MNGQNHFNSEGGFDEKTLSALLVLLLVLSMAIPALGEKNKADRSFSGNLFKLTTTQDFSSARSTGS